VVVEEEEVARAWAWAWAIRRRAGGAGGAFSHSTPCWGRSSKRTPILSSACSLLLASYGVAQTKLSYTNIHKIRKTHFR
jgi:hypothetical protein